MEVPCIIIAHVCISSIHSLYWVLFPPILLFILGVSMGHYFMRISTSIDLTFIVLVIWLFNYAVVLKRVIIFHSLTYLYCLLSFLVASLLRGIILVMDACHKRLEITEWVFVEVGWQGLGYPLAQVLAAKCQ